MESSHTQEPETVLSLSCHPSDANGLLDTRKGLFENSLALLIGKRSITCPPRTWIKQQSPRAVASQRPSYDSPVRLVRWSPRNAAAAPLRTFSSAYQGSGFRLTTLRQRSWSLRREVANRSGESRPSAYDRTSSFAHRAEKEVSVAPSATATRKSDTSASRSAGSCFGQKASSYSSSALPDFGSQKACAKRRTRGDLSKIARPGSDIQKLDHRYQVGVEDETARAVRNTVALIARLISDVGWKHVRHAEEQLSKLIRQAAFGVRQFDRRARHGRQVEIEKQSLTVTCADLFDGLCRCAWIAIRGFPVSNVDDHRRERVRMLQNPRFQK